MDPAHRFLELLTLWNQRLALLYSASCCSLYAARNHIECWNNSQYRKLERNFHISLAVHRFIIEGDQVENPQPQSETATQSSAGKISLFRKRWFIRQTRWIVDAKLLALLLPFKITCHPCALPLLQEFVIKFLRGLII